MQSPTKRRKMETNGDTKYSPFEVPLNDQALKTPRKLRVVCIGAGFAGDIGVYCGQPFLLTA
jgi:hypothetical protein